MTSRFSARIAALAAITTAVAVFAFPAAAPAAEDLPPGGSFTDDNGIAEEGFIEAIAAIGVTKGCNPPANTEFCPDAGVTRGQMASFFVRALELPATANRPFTDTAESVHDADIAALYEAGVTRGCNPPDNDEYCPERIVTRGEMAAFIARGWNYTGEVDPARFSDDNDSVFEADISRIATAGITKGCGEGTFCPNEPMQRKHMAVFLGRALELKARVVPPAPRTLGTFTTYYKRCSDPCRVTNIQLIGDAVDGTVVPPGEVFSVNDLVGIRREADGYVAAGAIIGGKLVCCDQPVNIGGGTSQFATTLYNAIFFAGVEDVYHRPHSIWFSRYPMGREATLGFPGPDVKFRNTTNDPITIDVSYTETSITVSLIGISNVAHVKAYRTGSATTAAGGRVTIKRVVTYKDGQTETQRWTHTYNGLKKDTPPPPPPPPPPPDDNPPPSGGGGGGLTPL